MEETNPRPVVVEEVDGDPLDRIVDEILGETPEPVEAEPAPEEEVTEEEQEEVAEEASEEPEYFEFKHNGKPVKLNADEVVEYVQKGYDYTRKTQELSDQRKQVEQYAQHVQQQAAFQQQFQGEIAKIAAMDMQLERFKAVDWSNWTDQDPVEATKGWQRFQLLQQQRHELSNGLSQRQAQMQYEMQARTEKHLTDASHSLEMELGKAWNAETRQALKATGKEYGFNDDELSGIQDPRIVKVLYDAYQWRQLQAKKPEITKRANEAPKLAKPGAKPAPARDERKAKLSKMLKGSTVRKTREAAAFALLDDFVR